MNKLNRLNHQFARVTKIDVAKITGLLYPQSKQILKWLGASQSTKGETGWQTHPPCLLPRRLPNTYIDKVF